MALDISSFSMEKLKGTMAHSLGMEITKLEKGYVEGTMPVDKRTHQPMGLLHGGASAALAETLGSIGSAMCIDTSTHAPVGIEINCNHVRGKKSGIVTGKATQVHQGGKIHIWNIEIVDEEEKLIATSRLTVMIIAQP
jgi:1,4-dihydroxy-2-naphthoyl-CoA hydrolase